MQGPGALFIDGSCTTHPIPECRRAAWSVVRVCPEGQVSATFSGVVPIEMPQTPQAAEYFAGGVAAQVAYSADDIMSDCENVVRHFRQPGAISLCRRGRYAGVVRSAHGYEGFAAMQRAQKVRAHVDPASCASPSDRFLAIGNEHADVAAKAALLKHPGQSSEHLRRWSAHGAESIQAFSPHFGLSRQSPTSP